MERDCKTAALKYLSYRERSSFELERHLKSKEFSDSSIRETMEYLKDLNYIDDQRYCMAYGKEGCSKGKGPLRIRQELKEKGMEEQLIADTLADLFTHQDEKNAALSVADKILRNRMNGEDEEIDEKTLARIGRRLSGLGYHTSIIYEILGQLRKS